MRRAHDLAKDWALVEVRRRQSLPERPLARVEPEQLEQRVLPVGGGTQTHHPVGVELGPEVSGRRVQSAGAHYHSVSSFNSAAIGDINASL